MTVDYRYFDVRFLAPCFESCTIYFPKSMRLLHCTGSRGSAGRGFAQRPATQVPGLRHAPGRCSTPPRMSIRAVSKHSISYRPAPKQITNISRACPSHRSGYALPMLRAGDLRRIPRTFRLSLSPCWSNGLANVEISRILRPDALRL